MENGSNAAWNKGKTKKAAENPDFIRAFSRLQLLFCAFNFFQVPNNGLDSKCGRSGNRREGSNPSISVWKAELFLQVQRAGLPFCISDIVGPASFHKHDYADLFLVAKVEARCYNKYRELMITVHTKKEKMVLFKKRQKWKEIRNGHEIYTKYPD